MVSFMSRTKTVSCVRSRRLACSRSASSACSRSNGDARKMGDLLYQVVILGSGAARLAIVGRECPSTLPPEDSIGVDHTLRSPCASADRGSRPTADPSRDVADPSRLPAVSGRSARAHGRADDGNHRLPGCRRSAGRELRPWPRQLAFGSSRRIEARERSPALRPSRHKASRMRSARIGPGDHLK